MFSAVQTERWKEKPSVKFHEFARQPFEERPADQGQLTAVTGLRFLVYVTEKSVLWQAFFIWGSAISGASTSWREFRGNVTWEKAAWEQSHLTVSTDLQYSCHNGA